MSPVPTGKFATGIEGFDTIARGGLLEGRATLISGTTGAGKTVLAASFLAQGIARGENVVFVTFEVAAGTLRRDLTSLGMDVSRWESEGRWIFVDGAEMDLVDTSVLGNFDLSGLLARVKRAITRSGAKRVAFDALDIIAQRLAAPAVVRDEVVRLVTSLQALGVTSIFTAERPQEDGPVTRDGVVEFAMDSVVLVRNRLKAGQRRRTIEILKMRGAGHERGEFTFTIRPAHGMAVLPRTTDRGEPLDAGPTERLTAGDSDLNELVSGGVLVGSTILVMGNPGTGKTTLALDFVKSGLRQGERALYVDFECPRRSLLRQAASTGHNIDALEREGTLRVLSDSPESTTIEDHLASVKEAMESFSPTRVVIDGLRSIERIADAPEFRDFMVDLGASLRHAGVTSLLTTTASLDRTQNETPHVSTLADVIIVLRFVESAGHIDRALTVLKSRGSAHDASVRQYRIDGTGFHVLEAYNSPVGILGERALAIPTGSPRAAAKARDP